MDKVKVAILFGGCSEEHEVSVKSAIEVAAHIDNEKYEPLYIGITKSGAWKLCEKPGPDWENGDCCTAVLSPDKNMHGLLVIKNQEYEIRRVDAAFPVLHGKSGEDGAIQGLFELSGIPFVGCDIQGSAICMDKSLAYIMAKHAGIATPEFWVMDKDERPAANALTYPVFVKPARSGSSFGVTKVGGPDELDAALESAKQYDSKILIEQAVSGCEVGCAVMGNGSELIVGEVDQIRLRHGIFRIHQEAEPEKGSENASITVPADLPAVERRRIQETAKQIYKALGCKGLSRVDMFLQDTGRIVLNEVNTLPGFTSYSRYPRMMAAAGMTLRELIDRLILLALKERG
ncbi:D-alanine---(R)-lactate ligase [Paenibacillus sp. UNCCL117]|uniref:D-alanine--(R)-lactate ligase n=1 Tax=unclassified Paenibacillus TaxID=185978 RepID=UPI0008894501|nr:MULTISPECIES: D-alanine--(R)-lactate ligase [unclassified Paenibacillus]SDC55266.1 D-alanine---(R)-lactate ligase [Paenibacillus sp. cl123]SFW10948.1 D-alanine---(R)-lactate ligase [Paenibacillus sp. UNCCL117]